MPPPITINEQAELLLAMIKHAENFKTNWDAVGKECNTTASAVSQRYGRIVKVSNAGGNKDASDSSAPNTPRKTPVRKKKAVVTTEADEDIMASPSKKRKTTKLADNSSKVAVKKEEDADDGDEEAV